jgi:hypothetical protein
MLSHVALITLGYAGVVHANAVRQLWDLVVTYPGMLLVTVGAAFLVLVVVTSLRAARRRLRYESWHLLHLYAYLGVGLALPHQIWTGDDFLASAWARAYWWTLYTVAAGAVLVYRLGLPAWLSWRHRLLVAAVVPEGPWLTSVYLHGRHLDRLPVRAGQWGAVQVAIVVTDGKITAVRVPVYPDGNPRDRQLNAYALPELTQETLAAQNADIDTISGATVTSDGYLQSLQAALDAAHL